MENSKPRTLNSVSLITIASGIVGLVYFFYLLLWPVKVLEIKGNVKILTPEVKVGGDLIYEIDMCKYTDLNATISRQDVIACDKLRGLS